MNTAIFRVLLSIATVACLTAPPLRAVSSTPAEIAEARQWSEQLEQLPPVKSEPPFFSFTYDGKPSAELLPTWKKSETSRKLDDQRTERTLTWTDPKTGMEVRCVSVAYSDYPVVEWTVYFKNTGKADTPILADIQGLNVSFQRNGEGDYVLRTIRGDDCSAASYQPIVIRMGGGTSHRFAPVGGRPTNGGYPYFNVEWSGQGVIAVLGWPGQWAAQFDCDKSSRLTIRGGQELTRLKLLPGEEIRTPLSVLMFWKGDAIRSQNLWRRWMIAHNIPRTDGKLPPVFTSCMGPTGEALQPVAAAEIAAIDAYQKAGFKHDYWWIDAGWYPCKGDWGNVGTWEPDPKRFPKGIKEVSDHAHANGMKFVLWFEPERVTRDTWLAKNHPQWILGGEKGGLLNLGNPEARKWLVGHIDRFIKEQGVDLYREDFNIDPLGYWRGNDAPDRQGITENLHVQGHLAYWDELRRRHPDILIDSCASGGRRDDLETLAAPCRCCAATTKAHAREERLSQLPATRDTPTAFRSGCLTRHRSLLQRSLRGAQPFYSGSGHGVGSVRRLHQNQSSTPPPHGQLEGRGRRVLRRLLSPDEIQPIGRCVDGVAIQPPGSRQWHGAGIPPCRESV